MALDNPDHSLSQTDVERIARAVVLQLSKQHRCAAITKAGNRCPKPVIYGSRFCFIHDCMSKDGRLPDPAEAGADGDELLE